jgi:hypothetical protein
MRHVLIVLSNPVAGREDEYNDWYDNVHLGEVLQVPGFVAAQRFVAAPALPGREGPPRQYLAIYELETDDLQASLAALTKAAPGMDISSAIDASSALAYPFTVHGPRVVAE